MSDEKLSVFDLESVYDEQISPLMKQILEICKEHELPMYATFVCAQIEDEDPLLCTSYIPRKGVTDTLAKMDKVARDGWNVSSPVMAFTITSKE